MVPRLWLRRFPRSRIMLPAVMSRQPLQAEEMALAPGGYAAADACIFFRQALAADDDAPPCSSVMFFHWELIWGR
jgi:hypothetical protein